MVTPVLELLLGREQETGTENFKREQENCRRGVLTTQFTLLLLDTVKDQISAWKLWLPRGPAVTIAEVAAAAAVLKTRVNLWRNAALKSCIVWDEFWEREVSAQFITGSD